MRDRVAISSDIAIGTEPRQSRPIIVNDRRHTAEALVDLLRRAGIDCELVGSETDRDFPRNAATYRNPQ